MMFMIPTPPTTSEISATHNSSAAIRLEVEARALLISVRSRMLNSSGWPGRMWCRSCSSSVIWRMAWGMSSVVLARKRIWSTLVKRISCGV
jgi:hypothetical protein